VSLKVKSRKKKVVQNSIVKAKLYNWFWHFESINPGRCAC
jgi:hypothetical protein